MSPTPPFLPPELWLQVLSHIDDPLFLWRLYRLGPTFLRAPSHFLLRNDWIPNRTILDYQHDQYWIGGRFTHFYTQTHPNEHVHPEHALFTVGRITGDRGIDGLLSSQGLSTKTGINLYIVVQRCGPGWGEQTQGKALLTANFMRGHSCLEHAVVKWDNQLGNVTDDKWVYIREEGREKGVVGFDWQGLMDRFLVAGRGKETFSEGRPGPYKLLLP